MVSQLDHFLFCFGLSVALSLLCIVGKVLARWLAFACLLFFLINFILNFFNSGHPIGIASDDVLNKTFLKLESGLLFPQQVRGLLGRAKTQVELHFEPEQEREQEQERDAERERERDAERERERERDAERERERDAERDADAEWGFFSFSERFSLLHRTLQYFSRSEKQSDGD